MKLKFSFKNLLLFILFSINLLLVFLPLTNILGYEFSLVNSILIFFISGFASIKGFSKNNGIIEFFSREKLFFGQILIIPFIVSLVSTVLFSYCPFTDGSLFYLTLTVPTVFLGSSFGIFISYHSSRLKYLIFTLVSLLILCYPLIEFYFNPQIYFYNFIFGFLPGTIYDEDLSINRIILSYRLFCLAFAITLLLLTQLVYTKKLGKTKSISIVVVVLSFFVLLKPSLGFSTDNSKIKSELNGLINTEHFDIYYQDKSIDSISKKILALRHEYFYEEIKEQLELKYEVKITSYVFTKSQQKRLLFGSGNADVAKPWLKQIYLNFPTYNSSLKHELVHVMAAEFGTTPFQVASGINPALIEGFAMAIEDDYDNLPIHYFAALGLKTKFKHQIKNLFEGFTFFSKYPTISYLQAGSFIQYIIDKYGINKAKEIYSGSSFESIYLKNLKELENDYENYIDSMDVEINNHKAMLYFGGQPIFKKFCARSAASQTRKAATLLWNKEYELAYAKYKDVYEYSNTYYSLIGMVNSLFEQKKEKEADILISNELYKFRETRYFYNLELVAGDLKVKLDDSLEALRYYDSLLVQNPHHVYKFNIALRKQLLLEGTEKLQSFLLGDDKRKLEILLSLNKDEIFYESIPIMLNLKIEKADLEKIVNEFSNKIEVTNFSSSYGAFVLSDAAVNLGELEIAKKLAVLSLQFQDNKFFTKKLIENLKFINWLVNSSDEIKIEFHD